MSQILPSWRKSAARESILEFIEEVTREGGPDYVPPSQRIAVFDNDGTLWCEQPLQPQVLFAHERANAMARAEPALLEREAFRAFAQHDIESMHKIGKQGLFEFAFDIHAGMNVETFQELVRHWLMRARHPVFNRSYTELVYHPQLELMSYLRINGFKTFIVTGGGIDFVRTFAEQTYGVPPEQVIGSSVKSRYRVHDGKSELLKLAELGTFDDRDVKPQNIWLHIGRKPIFAFGNSDGDMAMMRYVLSGPGRRLAMLLHHDDNERETAYDRDFKLSPLNEALDRAGEFGFHVVSVKEDWSRVFTRELLEEPQPKSLFPAHAVH